MEGGVVVGEDVLGEEGDVDVDVEVEVEELGEEEICVRPRDVRSEGWIQFPAPPRPVCRYSGAGWEEVRARVRSTEGGIWVWDSRSPCLILQHQLSHSHPHMCITNADIWQKIGR